MSVMLGDSPCWWVPFARLVLPRSTAQVPAFPGDLDRRNNVRHRRTGHPHPIGLARCRGPRNGEQPHTQGSGVSSPRGGVGDSTPAADLDGRAKLWLRAGKRPLPSRQAIPVIILIQILTRFFERRKQRRRQQQQQGVS